jgi:hypothetical protein
MSAIENRLEPTDKLNLVKPEFVENDSRVMQEINADRQCQQDRQVASPRAETPAHLDIDDPYAHLNFAPRTFAMRDNNDSVTETSKCDANHDQSKEKNATGMDKNSQSRDSVGAKLDEFSTGDKVIRADGKIEVVMPSGETLSVQGNSWVLKDREENVLAKSNKMPEKLDDGATLEHIVPIMGPGWTNIDYPNGDHIEIGRKSITIKRGSEEASIPKTLEY